MNHRQFETKAEEFLNKRTKQRDNLVITRAEAKSALIALAMDISEIQIRDYSNWLHELYVHNEIGGRSFEALWHDYMEHHVKLTTAIGGNIEK
jgi:hypothetical protein